MLSNYLVDYLEKKGFIVKKKLVINSVPFSSFFLNEMKIWEILNFLVNLIPSRIYPYFGEILVIANNR